MVRYFLFAPDNPAATDLIACADAACAAGDCASIVVPESLKAEEVTALQTLGLAVLIADCEPRIVSRLKADGLHLGKIEHKLADLRASMPKDVMIGVDCGTSRHAAMEAAEQGADYVGFRQKSQTGGEPLVKWWNDLAEIPAVPLQPATPDEAIILAQYSDFIRPGDEMWQSPAAAKRVVSELNAKLK